MEALADKQEQERDAFSNESETIKSGDALVHVRPVTLNQDTSLCMTLRVPEESCTVRYPGQGPRGSCIVLAKWQYNNILFCRNTMTCCKLNEKKDRKRNVN